MFLARARGSPRLQAGGLLRVHSRHPCGDDNHDCTLAGCTVRARLDDSRVAIQGSVSATCTWGVLFRILVFSPVFAGGSRLLAGTLHKASNRTGHDFFPKSPNPRAQPSSHSFRGAAFHAPVRPLRTTLHRANIDRGILMRFDVSTH
jgi:hypothetical protein